MRVGRSPVRIAPLRQIERRQRLQALERAGVRQQAQVLLQQRRRPQAAARQQVASRQHLVRRAVGDDPPIGDPHGTDAEGNLDYTETAGYSGEEQRATAIMDMVRMAFACDLSRVAAIRMTMDQTFLNMKPLSGAGSDMHELSHGSVTAADHADAVGWHVKHFARLIALLRDTQELDGSSLLDHTALVLLFEGGYGFDPESGQDGHAHSSENMVALVGGRTGGLVPGVHLAAPGLHPANALVCAMQAVGLDTDTLGEISGVVPGLIG